LNFMIERLDLFDCEYFGVADDGFVPAQKNAWRPFCG
jgi:hypothetical protein